MPKLPQINGRRLVWALRRIGYVIERQRGSHVRMSIKLPSGTHYISVPIHDTLDKGTLHDILSDVARHNNISQEDILELV